MGVNHTDLIILTSMLLIYTFAILSVHRWLKYFTVKHLLTLLSLNVLYK